MWSKLLPDGLATQFEILIISWPTLWWHGEMIRVSEWCQLRLSCRYRNKCLISKSSVRFWMNILNLHTWSGLPVYSPLSDTWRLASEVTGAALSSPAPARRWWGRPGHWGQHQIVAGRDKETRRVGGTNWQTIHLYCKPSSSKVFILWWPS